MADPKQLARFTIAEAEEGYILHIEDDAGHTLELRANDDQLDLIIEELDRVLGEDDAAGDEDYEGYDDEPDAEDA
jgi:hypothetical protein